MRIALIGNYAPDGQQSMRRYAELICDGLLAARHEVALAVPQAALNSQERRPVGIWKWAGYVDKYLLGTTAIARAARWADVVHVCDHSNAVYIPPRLERPYVVTCHDLLAVRGALGEDTDCPASPLGRILQRRIVAGLRRAHAVACVSDATRRDAERLLHGSKAELVTVPNALNHPYRRITAAAVAERLAEFRGLEPGRYVLHVGTNLRRKNRECMLRAVAHVASSWSGSIVLAGQGLTPELGALCDRLGIRDRVVEARRPSNDLLEALYNGALALIFPSRFEGFGWPIVEAQACGCPVVCSNRAPLPEVAGDAAILCDPDDESAFGEAILQLATDSELRGNLSRRGLDNATRYGCRAMIERFVALYERVLGRT